MKYKNKLEKTLKGLELKPVNNREKSFIHVIFIPLNIANISWIWYFLFKIMWEVHILFYPNHKGELSLFWGRGISVWSFLSSFLMVLPLFFVTLPIALIISNLLVYSFSFLRQKFEKDIEKIGGKSFKDIIVELLIFFKILAPIGLLLSFIGAITLVNLS